MSATSIALIARAREFLASDALAPWPRRAQDLQTLDEQAALLQRRYTIAVVGEFSSGKSFLLNALLGKTREENGRIAGLLAVDINPSTATITELEYGTQDTATARYPSGREERIPIDGLARFVAVAKSSAGALHDATDEVAEAPAFVTIQTNSPFLASGFVVADTPGLASLNPAHRRATLAYLPFSDAVVYLIDTMQPFGEGDAAFLGLIGEHVSTIFIVQTKIDLWRAPEPDGRPAWQHARDRIVARAQQYAPRAQVFSLSAFEYAAGSSHHDAAAIDASGLPALAAALENSVRVRVERAREARAAGVVKDLLERASARLNREETLVNASAAEIDDMLARAKDSLEARERTLARQRDDIRSEGTLRAQRLRSDGEALAEDVVRALNSALDVSDIARIRDRNKLHMLVDETSSRVLSGFAASTASDLARSLEHATRHHPDARAIDAAAARFGGQGGVGAWAGDMGAGLRAAIVLGAVGGPAISFVENVAAAFANHQSGAYMKRELANDLRERFFPELRRDLERFAGDIAERIEALYGDVADAVEHERLSARAEHIAPIERAEAIVRDRAALAAESHRIAEAGEQVFVMLADLPVDLAPATPAPREPNSGAPPAAAFDERTYDRGLRPQRYRVAVLGALRRGKSMLINAIAQTRLLSETAGAEARFPVHVRYGPEHRAYALDGNGNWQPIAAGDAMRAATRSAVLIEVPWSMPRELVLVHAPAFDSGEPQAEDIALAAAKSASEVVGLFSRQLSERELGVYARVTDLGKPLTLAHSIADNEAPSERRAVVALAQRYLEERQIPVARIFTISALDALEAAHAKRPAAPWNELGALREILGVRAEEHMRALERREPASERGSAPSAATHEATGLKSKFARFFGSRRE